MGAYYNTYRHTLIDILFIKVVYILYNINTYIYIYIYIVIVIVIFYLVESFHPIQELR